MTYEQAVQWLFDAVPNFQRDGGTKDYKIGLDGPKALWEALNFPGKTIPTIHVAGTNGKGSTVHLLASGMKEMGLRVGVFSSPHLFDFRERAKIGTEMVPEEFVRQFVETNKDFFAKGGYSFFELTTMLALAWFEQEAVDWIVLETGMGGRLDATNICEPELTLITNIGLDHTQWLGSTLAAIATEKSGIMKEGVPVIIGEAHVETREVFIQSARAKNAPLFWSHSYGIATDLMGSYQTLNSDAAATALDLLFPAERTVWELGFSRVVVNTGLQGRWQKIQSRPTVICDTGHNEHALRHIVQQAHNEANHVHWVLGMAADKEHAKALQWFPKTDSFYWTSTQSKRCLSSDQLAKIADEIGYNGATYTSVEEALNAAINLAKEDDLIFVGGSTFVVADLKL
ncbi:Mur ligase family protein [Schleiferiaceae bacterium]|jgi:dihydrofolate synthase/folylpolyglutamate synthase|nr:Mur ligase family protein [Schleiferiaceae bacterium]MDC0083376.1 Mur ligase family protein [Schleiferiaceae bacterium]MDC0118576.1 Mur ligase family protein [Schleiferiaceae bacterium]